MVKECKEKKEARASGGYVHGHEHAEKHKLEEKKHRAKGGNVEMKEKKGEDGESADEPLKRGGAAKKKEGHHAHGGMAKPRADKRARGGKVMTPHSPLSGAMPKENRPGFSEKQKIGKEND